MTRNIGGTERILRIVAGLVLIALAAKMRPDQIEEAETVKGLVAEVARLRRLPDEISAEAHAVPIGDTFLGGGLHGTPRFDVMMWAVSRIRAALRGGR